MKGPAKTGMANSMHLHHALSGERAAICIKERSLIRISSPFDKRHLTKVGFALSIVLWLMCRSPSASAADCTSPLTSFKAGTLGVQQLYHIASDPTNSGNLTNSCDPYDQGIYATQVEASNGDDGVAYSLPLDQVSGTLYGAYSVYLSPSEETIYYTATTNPGIAYSNVLTIWTYDSSSNIVSETITVDVPAASVPGAPTIGIASASNSQATVSFTAPISDGGNPITSYTVTSSPGSITVVGSNSPVIVGGLSNGTAYTFTVSASNAYGTGPASQSSNTVIPLTVPGAPTNVLATAGNGQAAVTFGPPVSNGGAAITGYTATSSPGGLSATGNASPITVTGLTDGVSYTFTMTAANVVGPSVVSAPSNPVTPAATPIAEPVSVTVAYGASVQPIQLNIAGGTSSSVSIASPPSHGVAQASGTVITYSPSSGYFGPDAFTYTASNLTGVSPAATISVIITAPIITISSTSLASGVEGSLYTQGLVVMGGQAPYSFSPSVVSGALPGGLGISTTGVISGTPTAICTCTFTVMGTDSSTPMPQSFTSSPISLSVVESPSTVNRVTPSSTSSSGGATITITGTNFTPGSTVKFGPTAAAEVTYLDSDMLIAIAPAGTGTVDVTVTTAGGISAVSAADQLTYVGQVSGLSNPTGVAVDGSGSIYIVDADLSSITRVPPGCVTRSCKAALGGGLTSPTGVAIDGNGTLYVLSGGSDGILTKLIWNASTLSYGQPSVVATGFNLSLSEPSGIAVDSAGNLVIADTNNQRIVELPWIANATAYGDLIVVDQESGSSKPNGVAIAPNGDVYIADSGMQTVSRVTAGGVHTILANSVSAVGVALDRSGDVYYSDSNAGAIAKLPWNGSSFGSSVIVANNLAVPYGITVDDSGNVYAAVNKSANIVKVSVTSPPNLNFMGTRVAATSVDSPMVATLGNIGNTPLAFLPSATTGPQIGAGFMLDPATTCPEVPLTSPLQTIPQGASCEYAVTFAPISVGASNAAVIVFDDNLNSTNATQSIALSGVGILDDVSLMQLTLAPASVINFGTSITVTAAVSDTTVPTHIPTGDVQLSITSSGSPAVVSSVTLPLTNGSAVLSSLVLPNAGAYTITGTYSGAVGSVNGSAATGSFNVTKAAPTLIYVPAVTTQSYASPVPGGAINATAVDATGMPIPGTFVYKALNGSTSIAITAGGTLLPAGTYTLLAIFTPTDTADYVSGASITAVAAYSVTQLSASIVLGGLSQVYSAGEHVPNVVTTPANLKVELTYNGSAIAPVDPGSYVVVATVSSPNYVGSGTGTLVIGKAVPSSVVLSSGTDPVLVKSTLLLTATVGSTVSVPTGMVSFFDGANILGSTAISNGVASLAVSSLSVGTHILTAVYQGDSDFLTLTSSATTQNVLDFILTVSTPTGAPPTTTTQAGGTATCELRLSPTGLESFPADVTFTVTGLPPGATYKLTPPSISAGAGPTNVVLSVILAQPSSPLSGRLLARAPLMLTLAILPFGAITRRSSKRMPNKSMVLLLLVTLSSLVMGISGCAGSGTSAQQEKSYILTLTATSGGLVYASTVTLIVD